MDHLRRFLFALAVFIAAFLIFSMWRSGREGYGLLNLLRGEKPPGEAFTPPAVPKLDLGDVQVLARLNDESARLAAAVLPAVVSVNTKTIIPGQRYFDPFWGRVYSGRSQVAPGLGSGAIISKEGHVVTNFHVIDQVDQVEVITNDQKKYPARIINADKRRDIALLKIESSRSDFPALSFADSRQVKVGQIVFAVGNPFGLSGTVTQGIISARDRHLSDSSLDYLQTDTVINPGNSGGPLVNIRGEIVGINVAIFQGENSQTWQGVGLAIPASEAKAIIDEILAMPAGSPAGAAVGYLGLDLGEQLVRVDASFGGSGSGALVLEVIPGSPASAAGLRPEDVILQFAAKPVRSPDDLFAAIRSTRPGTRVEIALLRDGQPAKVTATIGQRPVK